jgi:hypothetical protein
VLLAAALARTPAATDRQRKTRFDKSDLGRMDEGSDSLARAILCGHGVNGTDSFSLDTLTGRLRGEDDDDDWTD